MLFSSMVIKLMENSNEYFLKNENREILKRKRKKIKVITITQYKISREPKEKSTSSIAKK